MEYLLSVDGGGTKTEFYVSDIQGNILHEFVLGGSNYKSVGIENMKLVFQEGMNTVKEKFQITYDDIKHSVWGISGYDSKKDYELIEKGILQTGISSNKVHLCNDGVLGFYAQSNHWGVVISSGTGSIVIGVDQEGKTIRIGGWGFHISDIGSGYWIGNKVVQELLLYCEGCREYAEVFGSIKTYLKAETYEEIPYIIAEMTQYNEIAKFAYLVMKANEEKDLLAYEILKEAARVLSKMASAAYQKMASSNQGSFDCVLSGGVLKNQLFQEILKDEVTKRIDREVIFYNQVNAPAYGGIILCKKQIEKM